MNGAFSFKNLPDVKDVDQNGYLSDPLYSDEDEISSIVEDIEEDTAVERFYDGMGL